MKTIILSILLVISSIIFGQDTIQISTGNYAVVTNQGTTYFSTIKNIDSLNKVACMRFDRVVDEFDKSVTITYDVNSDVSFIKIIKNGFVTFYLSIYIKEAGIYTGTGVSLILSQYNTNTAEYVNKLMIKRPNQKVDYSYIGSDFYTTAFIKLTPADLELFKKSDNIKYKLYISNGECNYETERIKCLIKSK